MRKSNFAPNEPQEAVRFFLNRLVPDLADRINVDVYFRRMKKQIGQCWMAREWSKRNFVVTCRSGLSRRKSLKVLAHECVHIMQYATGKLSDINPQQVLWKRSEIIDYPTKATVKEYNSTPWESEAIRMEEKLVRAYLRHLKKTA